MKRLVYLINADWYFELHWLERAKASIHNGYEVFVIMKFSDEEILKKIKLTRIHLININMTRKGLNPFIELFSIINIFKIMRKIKPDVVHTITVKPNLYGSLVCMYQQIPFVCSVTGLGYAFSNKSIKAVLIKFVIKLFYKVISLSHNYKILFENNDDLSYMVDCNIIPAQNAMCVAGSGVDCELYTYHAEPLGKIKILCASRMIYDKGITNIIEAARILKNDEINCEIHIAGILDDGNPNAIPEEKLLKWHREELIIWLGKIDNMPELIRTMHVSILPTNYGEGIPRFLIESAACGRPIITTDVPGCREIVDHNKNGILVEPNDTIQLVRALKRLIYSKEIRESMGQAGRKKVLGEYSQGKVISQTLKVYDELLQVK